MSVTVSDNSVTVDTSEPGRYACRMFPTLKAANQHWNAKKPKNRFKVIDSDFATSDIGTIEPFDHAIHVERAFHAKIENVNILGPYSRGVSMHFCLYGSIRNVNVEGAIEGFFVGSGAEVVDPESGTKLWPDGEHHNSASNQARIVQARFHGQHDDAIGFILEGGDNVLFDQTTVEGGKCKTGWRLAPRAPWSQITLNQSWLEVPVKTAIDFDGYGTFFEIRKFNMGVAPEVFLDCRGDQGSTIFFEKNNWKTVPKIILGRTTNVELGKNSFSDDEFWDSVQRVK